MGNILYSVIPRTVIIDPNTIGLRGSAQNSGLSIQQVEENTEIINYDSIPQNEILNTECPISISPFTSNSVVLRLKRCKHCFVPFRMMAWLETHSTCPLCRVSVIETATGTGIGTGGENISQTPTANTNTGSTDGVDMTSLLNSIRDNLVNSFNNTTSASTATAAPTTTTLPASRTDLNNNASNAAYANTIFNRLSNLSIDNVNDDSIMFSFDMPSHSNTYASQVNDLNELSNSYIIPQLTQMFSNTMSRSMSRRTESTDNNDPNTDNNSDNDRMDLD
jgi:predicted Zn-ribbon and HTH transcriptional regulator